MGKTNFRRLWDELLAEGTVSITSDAIAERAGSSIDSVYGATRRATDDGLLFSPLRGLHVLVPPEYRSWGVVPADWFIDDMMAHLAAPYYVAYLSAAARHGASHQAAQQFQVVTEHRVASRTIGRVRLRFYHATDIRLRATTLHTGPTGMLHVATPEACVLDFAERPDAGGGIATLLEVLGELDLDPLALVRGAAHRTRAGVRRAGWLLSQTHPGLDLHALEPYAAAGAGRPTPLVAGQPAAGHLDSRWGVAVNTRAALAS